MKWLLKATWLLLMHQTTLLLKKKHQLLSNFYRLYDKITVVKKRALALFFCAYYL